MTLNDKDSESHVSPKWGGILIRCTVCPRKKTDINDLLLGEDNQAYVHCRDQSLQYQK